MRTAELEVWILVDADGNHVCTETEASLAERYEDQIQPLGDAQGTRRIRVKLTVPLPEVVEMSGEVPADGDAVLAVA